MDSLFDIPLVFIKENLNGWVILVIIIVIIYFVGLRDYYIKRENFFDKSQQIKNMEEIEEIEDNIMANENDEQDESFDENEEQEAPVAKKQNNTIKPNTIKPNTIKPNMKKPNMKKSKKIKGENHTVIKGEYVFEGFESPTTTNYAPIIPLDAQSQSTPQNKSPEIKMQTTQQIINTNVSTTLFDNLKLNTIQINLCKTNYNQVINTYFTDLLKLLKLQKNNEYLNTKKQFDVIIVKGIDNIMNYLANTIKSPLILTRTSIRTDIINNLTRAIELLINTANADITKQMNSLAIMNSTTIDYKTMLSGINNTREKIDEYIGIDKLVVNNGSNIGNYNKQVNKILDKSFVLPIYERNFDRINQLVKSDFNDNETNLANKYGQAYTDFLNEKKKDELDINPMRLASKIESGIVNMLTSLVDDSNSSKHNNYDNYKNNNYENDENNENDENYYYNNNNNNDNDNHIINQSNPVQEQSYNILKNTNLNKNANIYNDKGNLGNYLIDNKTKQQVLEGFEDSGDSKDSTTEKINKKNKDKNSNDNILSNILSGDFLQYIMENINDKLSTFYSYYNIKFGSGTGSGSGTSSGNKDKNNDDNNNKFNLEENMIPAGFLLFILSMLFYFIDTTS
jgi:hypothetical protein